ncbi:MAG: hypothetical protein ACKVT2_12685 [Saprospiraceae bacterium]
MDNYDKEIFLLANNLLFPEEPNVPTDRAFFEELLCSAPCGGPCYKRADFENNPDNPDFDCPNTPNWLGQRWEGVGGGTVWHEWYASRQFNGLDFMALYNLYMLHYPDQQTAYYNPNSIEGQGEGLVGGQFLGEDKIEGPTTLCPGHTGHYQINPYTTPPSQNLLWSGSPNLNIISPTTNGTNVQVPSGLTPSFIEADFDNVETIQQWINGIPAEIVIDTTFVSPTGDEEGYWVFTTEPVMINDECHLTYHQPLLTETPRYTIDPYIIPCNGDFAATAKGPTALPELSFSWTAIDPATGIGMTEVGPYIDFISIVPIGEDIPVHIVLTLNVQSPCGNHTEVMDINFETCDDGGNHERQIKISPNPAIDQISVRIAQSETEDFVSTDPNGVHILVYSANGGSTMVMDTYLYSNGQYYNIALLPNGVYTMQAFASDLTPIQANFSIVR